MIRTAPFAATGLLVVLIGLFGCGGGGKPAAGTERGSCFPNDTCNAGLTCLSTFCVRVDLDGGSNPDGAGDSSPTKDAAREDATDGRTPELHGDAAPHPRLPQVSNQGGPVLIHPRVQPIYYANESDVEDIQGFLKELTKTTSWSELTSEYGVGPLIVAPPIMLQGTAAVTMTNDMLATGLLSSLASGTPPWGAADPSTIYMVVLPQGSTVTWSDGSTCCSDYGGYHSDVTTPVGVTIPYAVICSCPGAFGLNLGPLDVRTMTVSHELVEAATDPFPNANPAFVGSDRGNVIWDAVTYGELADMCAIFPDANIVPPGSTYMLQRSWSNAAAAASKNPCVPRDPSSPTFGAYPILSAVNIGTAKEPYLTQGVQVPLGGRGTIDVVMSSDAPPDFTWSVGVYTYEDLRGGDTTNLGVSLDKTSGKNGDVLHLTLSPKRANPSLGLEAFVLISRFGAGSGLQSNVSMGVVVNK